jgi:hypothetical protein
LKSVEKPAQILTKKPLACGSCTTLATLYGTQPYIGFTPGYILDMSYTQCRRSSGWLDFERYGRP